MLNLVAIGKYITKLRNENNLSQQQLADTLYVTHQAVSKWENGLSIPNIEIMAELTKLFNITIDDLLRCDECLSNDFVDLLKNYPRNFCIDQLIKRKLNIKIEEVLYLLNNDERELIISNIINHNLNINISDLLPYLNIIERKRIINAILTKKINLDINELSYMLSKNEKIHITGGLYEY
jgi:transcriptional regulator with XRE-family HTH domain